MTQSQSKKRGILILNLGSPESTETKDVRAYLNEFLSDPRVLDSPAPIRKMVLNLFILPFRPKKSAEAYKKIWTDEGSPLIVITQSIGKKLAEATGLHVEVGMRYGNPSIPNAVKNIKAKGIEDVLVIPLYPHYAMSSYETAVVRAQESFKKHAPDIQVTYQQPFYQHPAYIDALAAVTARHLNMGDEVDHLLMSYHGIPERHVQKTDPSRSHCLKENNCCDKEHPAHGFCYRHQCFATSKALAKKLNLSDSDYSVSFQSRLGNDPWLQPFTDHVLEELPTDGVKRLAVISPAFIADCLETLEEVNMEGREDYLNAGGKAFVYIPCVNDDDLWIDVLAGFCEDYISTRQILEQQD